MRDVITWTSASLMIRRTSGRGTVPYQRTCDPIPRASASAMHSLLDGPSPTTWSVHFPGRSTSPSASTSNRSAFWSSTRPAQTRFRCSPVGLGAVARRMIAFSGSRPTLDAHIPPEVLLICTRRTEDGRRRPRSVSHPGRPAKEVDVGDVPDEMPEAPLAPRREGPSSCWRYHPRGPKQTAARASKETRDSGIQSCPVDERGQTSASASPPARPRGLDEATACRSRRRRLIHMAVQPVEGQDRLARSTKTYSTLPGPTRPRYSDISALFPILPPEVP